MTPALLALVATPLFGGAAWAGSRAGVRLVAACGPLPDGPAPVRVPRALFPLGGAFVGAALALHGTHLPALALDAFVVAALAGDASADLRCGLLPDALTLGPLCIVAGLGLVTRDLAPILSAAFVFVPFALAAWRSRGLGMGWGDVKLAALGGALLGARDATLACVVAALTACAVARRGGRPFAFGPYLVVTIALALSFHGRF